MSLSHPRSATPISVEDYLAGESKARHKHEYVDGNVYMMTGGIYNHHLIASRIFIELGQQLKNSPCEVLGSDSKVRIESDSRTWFYYPDITVVCGDNIRNDVFQDKPAVIVEVLSRSTRRIDEGEKWINYQKLPSLATYLMFEQELPAAIVYQRTPNGFERTVYDAPDAIIDLPEIEVQLALVDVYRQINFVREPVEEYADTASLPTD